MYIHIYHFMPKVSPARMYSYILIVTLNIKNYNMLSKNTYVANQQNETLAQSRIITSYR